MEFELKLTNGSWNDKLNDSNSTDFFNLKKKLEQEFDQVFCVKPDATVSQLNDSCRTEVTGFSEGSINVFFLLIRIELKQLFRGVAQLLVGFIYTFWFLRRASCKARLLVITSVVLPGFSRNFYFSLRFVRPFDVLS